MEQCRLIWPYLLIIYYPTMTKQDKIQFHHQTKIHMKSNRFAFSSSSLFITLMFRLKQQWYQRLAKSDSFYIRLADQIIKDISHSNEHLSRLKSKIFVSFEIFHFLFHYYVN